MSTSAITVRRARAGDLDPVNAVVSAAVRTWNLPQRVLRLALPGYRYRVEDLEHLHLLVAENLRGEILGVAAWEEARPGERMEDRPTAWLHGLYVHPAHHHRGLGRRLLEAAHADLAQQGYQAVLVKAHKGATGFFRHAGYLPLDGEETFPLRMGRTLAPPRPV